MEKEMRRERMTGKEVNREGMTGKEMNQAGMTGKGNKPGRKDSKKK